MTVSLPSKKSVTIDAPGEINSLTGKFIYNFYTRDETTNENPQNSLPGSIAEAIRGKGGVELSTILQEKNQRFIPRSVEITWTPVNIGTTPELIGSISISDNINSVQYEETIPGDLFSSVTFKDNGTDGKIMYAIRRALQEIVKSQNLPPIDNMNASPLDLAKVLNGITSTSVQGNFIAENFLELMNSDSGISFLDKPKLDKTVLTMSERLKDVRLKVSLNNKFIHTVLSASSQENDNVFGDETMAILPTAATIQATATNMHSSNLVSGTEYETDIGGYLSFEESVATDITSIYQNIGYILTRTEYPFAGGVGNTTRIIIENPALPKYVDYNVKYGTRYSYSIRTVFVAKLPALSDTGALGLVTLLVASQACTEAMVDCREFRPPEPPTDFNVSWDYNIGHPRLTWNFPVDSQRDTKYFQVFRRASIDEPYQLVKMYSFNDSTTPMNLTDLLEFNIDPMLVEDLRNKDGSATPKTMYIDMSFEKEHSAIYTVAAIDAHGQTSNYSTQLKVSFNKYKNKIVKELISVTGAPKAYPNFFYNKDTFVDSIRTSGVSSLDIYFNPEYLKITDRADHDLQFLKSNGNYDYQIQLINTDLQKDAKINIDLKYVPPANQEVPVMTPAINPAGIKLR